MASIDINLNIKGGLSQVTGGGPSAMLPNKNFGKELTIAEQAMKNIVNEQRSLLVKQKESELKKQFGIKDKNSGLGGMMQGIVGPLMKALGPIALIAVLVKSSKSLQKMVEGLGKLLMLLLKPIGDVLATFLKPIYLFFRPLAKAFNAYFRLYQQQANAAIRAGMTFQKAGMTGKASDSFNTAFLIVMKPFFNLLLLGFEGLAELVNNIFFGAIEWLIRSLGDAFRAVGWDSAAEALYDAADAVDELREKVNTNLKEAFKSFIEETDRALFDHVTELTAASENIKTLLVASMVLSEEDRKKVMDSFKVMDAQTLDDIIAKKPYIDALTDKIKEAGDNANGAALNIGNLAAALGLISGIGHREPTGEQSAQLALNMGALAELSTNANPTNEELAKATQNFLDIKNIVKEVNDVSFSKLIDKSLGTKLALDTQKVAADLLNTSLGTSAIKTDGATRSIESYNSSIDLITQNILKKADQINNASINRSSGGMYFANLTLPSGSIGSLAGR